MALGDTIIRLEGKFNDLDRRILRREGVVIRMFLLKKATESSRLTPIAEIVNGHRGSYSDYRQQQRFEIAQDSTGLSDAIAQTSHVAYGNVVSGEMDVYEIEPDRRDVVPPDGNQPSWKIYGTRAPQLRFTVVAAPLEF